MFALFHNLKVGHKLTLISVFFVIPDTLLLCFFLININSNIRFAQWEQHGNAYQQPLQLLLEWVPEHALAVERLGWEAKGGSDSNAVFAIEQKVDQAFQELAAVDARLGKQLQFTEEGLAKRNRSHCNAPQLQQEWEKLKSAARISNKAESTYQHRHLIDDVRTMITHAGDNSNLILDPDLDSYYLMDVTLLTLPEMQDRLFQVRLYGESLLASGRSMGDEERKRLGVFAAMLEQADLNRALTSTHTALNEDGNFYGLSPSLQQRIPPVLTRFESAQKEFINLVTALSQSGGSPISLERFRAAGVEASRSSFELWSAAVAEVDGLLERRMDNFRSQRNKSLAISAMAFICAFLFVSFITRSISGPLQRQASALLSANRALQSEISERERTQEALRVAEERYRSIFENAVEGIYQTTPDGRYIVANRTLVEMYGYRTFEELQASVEKIATQLYVEPDRRKEFCDQISASGSVTRFESQVYRADRKIIWISENARAVHDPEGKLLYYEGTVEDITDRKQAEAELAKVHRQLLDASRLAGKAEIATSILHNVGNSLNCVNLSVQQLSDSARRIKVGNLEKVAQLMQEQGSQLGEFMTQTPKGKQIPRYLGEFVEHLTEEQTVMVEEVARLRKHLDHLRSIVAMQQSYAKVTNITEEIPVAELIEEALQINGAVLNGEEVPVVREFGGNPKLIIDRHKTLQILVNLLRNAQHACLGTGEPDKRVVVSVQDSPQRVEIRIQDNGVGIPPENLNRIFNHGFTTRKDGHGFGLHSGAIAAREMGGTLKASSEGEGRGAVFTLELPKCVKKTFDA